MREWEVILRVTLLQNHQFNLQRVLWAQHKGKGSGWQLLLILMQKMLLNFWGASSLLFCQWVAQVNEHNPIYLAIYQPINLNSGFGCRMWNTQDILQCARNGLPTMWGSPTCRCKWRDRQEEGINHQRKGEEQEDERAVISCFLEKWDRDAAPAAVWLVAEPKRVSWIM